MKKLFIASLFISTIASFGQNHVTIAKFSYANTPLNKFENGTDKTKIEQFDLRLNFPIVLNEKHVLLTGLFGNKTFVKFDAEISGYTNLFATGLNIGLHSKYNEKWEATYMAIPKLASDFNGISHNDFQFGYLALFNYVKRQSLKFKFGVYGNSEKYGSLIVPIVGLYYLSPNEKLEMNLNLPLLADFNYKLSNTSTLGMNFDGLSSSYNLTRTIYIKEGEYAVIKSNELFAYYQLKIWESIYTKVKFGYSFYRTSEVFSENDNIDFAVAAFNLGDERIPLNENFNDGPIFKFELIYRINTNNKK